MVDLKTGKQVFEQSNIDPAPSIQKGNPVVPIGLMVPVKDIPAGNYRLDLQAYDTTGAITTIRTVQFVAE